MRFAQLREMDITDGAGIRVSLYTHRCELCGRQFNGVNALSHHIVKDEHLDLEEYYKLFIDNSPHRCKNCGKPNTFLSLGRGYTNFCSSSCGSRFYGFERIERDNSLIGCISDDFLVESINNNRSTKRLTYFNCRCCFCGRYKTLFASQIRNHSRTKCACRVYRDLLGTRIKDVKIIDYDEITKLFLVRCLCGKEFNRRKSELYRVQCGSDCTYKKLVYPNTRNVIGNRYGKLVVLSELDNGIFLCRCDCGNMFKTSKRALLQNISTHCGCSKPISKGEYKISELLTINNIDFIEEHYFQDFKYVDSNRHPKFDFYLPEFNCIIEFDGRYHFETNSFFGAKDEIRNRDKIKTQYCLDNNIKLIKIPYTHLKKLRIDDLLPKTSKFVIHTMEEFYRYANYANTRV